MEAQVMHWNTRYGSIDKCYDKPDGIAVLSYFMQVRVLFYQFNLREMNSFVIISWVWQVVGCPGIPDNPSLAEITNNLSKIKLMGSQTNISPCNFLIFYHGFLV